jgi:hypothetical protein
MQTKRQYIKLENLVFNPDNVRLVNNGDHLLESIKEEGIKKPLLIEEREDKFVVIQGNCRLDALNKLAKLEGFDFKASFPKGVPCDLVTSYDSDLERASVVCDHGEVRPLSSVFELILSVEVFLKWEPALKRNVLISRLANSLDLVFPLRNNKVLEKLRLAKEAGVKEYMQELVKVRTGVAQQLLQAAKGPLVIKEHYKALAMGEASPLPLTREQVGKLYSAHLQDQEIKDNGLCPYNRSNYGPNVLEMIKAIRESNATKEANASERALKPKALPASTIKTIQSGAQSMTLKKILGAILGEVQLDWGELDKALE